MSNLSAEINPGGTMSEYNTTIFRPDAALWTTDTAWDEAFSRVESYLRAHHLESRVLLNQVVTEIIAEAQAHAFSHPADEPVACAMQVTHARIGAWFARAGSESDWASERDRVHGRLALVIANLPGRWANHFLSTESVPPELAAAMASVQFQPGPELRFSNMPTAPLEFGLVETDQPHAVKQGLWVLMRAASVWLVAAGCIGVAWAASH
jgi:hypothetical protein